tara:strand:+ start:548 stop:733 length:186 start_codon:yes stop_codon:yes gene_type:complete
MSGDFHTSMERDMRDLKDRLASLEEKVKKSKLMMKRPNGETYERLVDVVCDIDERLEKLES